MSLMGEALGIHASTLMRAAGETITYVRGTNTISVTAVPGQSTFDEVASDGEVRSQMKTIDWLVVPSVLKIGGMPIEPQRGDQVIRSDGQKFDVLPGAGNTAWQWSDSRMTFYRIHTVRRVAS
jgi:hypothetical protein